MIGSLALIELPVGLSTRQPRRESIDELGQRGILVKDCTTAPSRLWSRLSISYPGLQSAHSPSQVLVLRAPAVGFCSPGLRLSTDGLQTVACGWMTTALMAHIRARFVPLLCAPGVRTATISGEVKTSLEALRNSARSDSRCQNFLASCAEHASKPGKRLHVRR